MFDSPFPKCPVHGKSYTVEITAMEHIQRCLDDSCAWQTPVIREFNWPDGRRSYFVMKD